MNHIKECILISTGIAVSPILWCIANGVSKALNDARTSQSVWNDNVPPAAAGLASVTDLVAEFHRVGASALHSAGKLNLLWILVSIPLAAVSFPMLVVFLPIIKCATR